MRTALSQFGWWATPAAAARFLETASPVADNHGDRVAAQRRAAALPGHELPTPMPLAEFYERFRRRPGDPPYHHGTRRR